jgi:hypothetical protein
MRHLFITLLFNTRIWSRIMPAVEITAAIIGAVATAGATAATTLDNQLSNQSGARGFVLENATSLTLYLKKASTPYHGYWLTSPPNEVVGTYTPQELYSSWLASGSAPSTSTPLPSDLNALPRTYLPLFTAWIKKQDFSSDIIEFSLGGANAGVGAVVVFETDPSNTDRSKSTGFVLMIFHGANWATTYSGCYIDTMDNIEPLLSGDDYLTTLLNKIYYIDNTNSSNTKLSSGESQRSSGNGYICDFASAVSTRFIFSNQAAAAPVPPLRAPTGAPLK